MTAPTGVPRRLVVTRALASLLVIAFVVGGPVARQVFGVRNELLRSWQMFNGFASDGELCHVVFQRRYGDGREVLLDRYAVLGYERWWEAPGGIRRMQTPADAEVVGRKLCRALAGDADVRVYARCATRTGWQRQREGEENLCIR